ncbi:MAG: hypothetical protein HOO96_12410 [Polyangiaceae bacterium]|nr:hypothetical protein [Polyangiaceae bacterium]
MATSMAQWRGSLAAHIVDLRTGRLQALFIPSDPGAARGLRLLSEPVPVVVASVHLWSIAGDARYPSCVLLADDLAAALSLAFHRHAAMCERT